MHEPILAVSQQHIDQCVRHMGKEIAARWLPTETIDVVVVLDGGFFFGCDLVRAIQEAAPQRTIRVHTVKCSRWSAEEDAGQQLLGQASTLQGDGLNILLVDCLMNTGRTLKCVTENVLDALSPRRIETCVLIVMDNPDREYQDPITYQGFKVQDFPALLGYGLHLEGCHRARPGVWSVGTPSGAAEATPEKAPEGGTEEPAEGAAEGPVAAPEEPVDEAAPTAKKRPKGKTR